MNNSMRQGYATKELAIAGAIQQMNNVELVGAVESAEQCRIRLVLRVNSQFKAEEKQRKLMDKLGAQNRLANQNRSDSKITKEMVYPKGRF